MSTETDKMSFENELTSLLHKIQQLEENIRLTENQIDKINKQWIIDSDSPLNSVISRDILQEDLEELVVMVFPSAKQVLVRIISKFQKMQQDQDKSEEMEFEEVKINIESDDEQEDVLDSWHPIEFNERDDETSQESSDPLGMEQEQSIADDKINSVVKTDKTNTKTSKRSILISKKTISKNKDKKSKASNTGQQTKIMVLELKRLSNGEMQKWVGGDLKSNNNVKTPDEGYRCPFCTSYPLVLRPEFLVKHIKQKHPEQEIPPDFFNDLKPFKCKFCDAAFTLKRYRLLHERIHTSQEVLHCDLCDWTGNLSRNLNRHKKRHHFINAKSVCRGMKNCPEKTATMKSDLRKFNSRKRQARTGTHLNKCLESVEEDELYRKVLAARIKMSEPKPKKRWVKQSSYKCVCCPRTFRTQQRRSTHVKIMHKNVRKISDDEEGYRCPFCTNCIVGVPKFLCKHVKAEHPEQEFQLDSLNHVKPFKCKVCNFAFRFKHNRLLHEKMHENGTKHNYNCDQCETKFKTLKGVQQHKKVVHLKIGYPCKMKNCKERYGSAKNRNAHIRECHPEIEIAKKRIPLRNCEICDKTIRIYNISDYPRHLKMHVETHPEILESHPEIKSLAAKRYEFTLQNCEICDKTLRIYEKTNYYNHLKTHVESHPDILERHPEISEISSSETKQKFTMKNCEICGKTLRMYGKKTYYRHLKTHVKTHPEILESHPNILSSATKQKFTMKNCEICGKTLRMYGKKTYYRHLKTHVKSHPEILKSHPEIANLLKPTGKLCPHCGKLFNYAFNLETHIKRIHMTEHVKCPKCVKELPVDKLENHIKTHEKWESGELKSTKYTAENSNIKCEQCGTYYANKHSLTLHNKRVHLNIRNILCSLCPRRFYKKESLAFHLKSHENADPRKKTVKPKPQEEEESESSMDEDDSSDNEIETEIVGEQDLQIPSQEVNVPVVETEEQQLYFQLLQIS